MFPLYAANTYSGVYPGGGLWRPRPPGVNKGKPKKGKGKKRGKKRKKRKRRKERRGQKGQR